VLEEITNHSRRTQSNFYEYLHKNEKIFTNCDLNFKTLGTIVNQKPLHNDPIKKLSKFYNQIESKIREAYTSELLSTRSLRIERLNGETRLWIEAPLVLKSIESFGSDRRVDDEKEAAGAKLGFASFEMDAIRERESEKIERDFRDLFCWGRDRFRVCRNWP